MNPNSSFSQKKKYGFVTFGNNAKERIIGHENVSNSSFSLIENILLIDELKHNLLSISQLFDKGFKVIFE